MMAMMATRYVGVTVAAKDVGSELGVGMVEGLKEMGVPEVILVAVLAGWGVMEVVTDAMVGGGIG